MRSMSWIEDEFLKVLRRVQREFQEIEESIRRVAEKELSTGCLEPLCDLTVTDSEVIVTIDLPGVEKENISLTATKDTLEVRAKSSREFRLRRWGLSSEEKSFREFHTRVRLPVQVEPENARARFRNGVLEVRLPRAIKGVKIEVK